MGLGVGAGEFGVFGVVVLEIVSGEGFFVLESGGVYERHCWLMCDVAETVPLSAGLGVHGVDVVVCSTFGDGCDFMFEGLATEGWLSGDVGGEVEWDCFASLNELCGGLNTLRCEKIESTA